MNDRFPISDLLQRLPAALGALVLAPACAQSGLSPTASEDGASMRIVPAGERETFTGGDENFTGEATIEMLFSPEGARDFGGATVTFRLGARHWHGATASSAMTHVALQGAVDGEVVRWCEHVSDEQYLEREDR